MRIPTPALALAATLAATPVLAFDCPDAKTVYFSDPANPAFAPFNRPIPRLSIRFENDPKFGRVIVVTEDTTKRRYHLESAGTGMPWAIAVQIGGERRSVQFRPLDLSSIAKPGAPDQALLFDDTLFWPRCVQ